MYSINCNGKLLSLSKPVVMGVINATSNSFYKGSTVQNINDAVAKAIQMVKDGASIIDVGGQSSKPQSDLISAEEELNNVIPIIKAIKDALPNSIISVDTFYAMVAMEAVKEGASIINDISAGNIDDKMFETVSSLNVPYICMHMQGTPKTMQINPFYENVVKEVFDFFVKKLEQLNKLGIKDVIVDVGLGFGKTIEHNFELLKNLEVFKVLQVPVLLGASRKSFIYKTLGTTQDEALNGTTVINTIALQKGINILRVHDVKEAVEAIELSEKFKNT